jgi:hypothetical protein
MQTPPIPHKIGEADFWNAEMVLGQPLEAERVYEEVLACYANLGIRVIATYVKADPSDPLWVGSEPLKDGTLELRRWGYGRKGQARTSYIEECQTVALDLAERLDATEPTENTLPSNLFEALIGWDSGQGSEATPPRLEVFQTDDLLAVSGLSAQVVHMLYASPTAQGLDKFWEKVFRVRAERTPPAIQAIKDLANTTLRQYFFTIEAEIPGREGKPAKSISYVGTTNPEFRTLSR